MKKLQEGIADIIVPVAPADVAQSLYIYAGISVVILAVLFIAWRVFYSEKAICQRTLKRDVADYIQQQRYADAVFSMACILRRRLGSRRLDYSVPLPSSLQAQHERWLSFLAVMQAMRYADTPLSEQAVQHIAHEAEYWLRKWP